MKKLLSICVVALMALSIMTGCSTAPAPTTGSSTTPAEAPSQKVIVNFEGTVASVDGGKITLQDGKVVLIDANTVFAGDPDTNNAVSKDIAVGNFIQGFTKDNPDASTVTAAKVYINRVPETKGGKIAINFEGTVADVSGDRITLEDGKVIITTADTVITDAESSSDVVIQKGDYIQGYTEGNPDAKEITASRIHRCTF